MFEGQISDKQMLYMGAFVTAANCPVVKMRLFLLKPDSETLLVERTSEHKIQVSLTNVSWAQKARTICFRGVQTFHGDLQALCQ